MTGPEVGPSPALVAGSSGRERAPMRRDAAATDRWFEPLHVRDEAAARDRIALQVQAGADVVLAPTWRSHRRALMEVGESRRAREWTVAAVRVAREGVEVGLERRATARPGREDEPGPEAEAPSPEGNAPGPEAEALGPSGGREAIDPPRVAGVLPDLEDELETGSGRLLPRDPAAARDYGEVAGHLADGEVDLLLVETRAGGRMARMAVEAAVDTDLPTWVAALGGPPAETDESAVLSAWAETCVEAGAGMLLLPDGLPERVARVAASVAVPEWGGVVGAVGAPAPEALDAAATAWLEAGARTLALLRGATPDRVRAIRAAIERVTAAEREKGRAESERWAAVVARGASMTAGGAALWLGPDGPADADQGMPARPPGFAWTAATVGDVARLPQGRFRLVVSPPATHAPLGALAACLDAGGILVVPLTEATVRYGAEAGLRVLEIDDRRAPSIAVLRREG